MYCDQKTAGGGWTVFQKRMDGSVNFYIGWEDYKNGFGNLSSEFWLGLDKIHRLTLSDWNKVRVDLRDEDGTKVHAEYELFAVASEKNNYKLSLGSYSGLFCLRTVLNLGGRGGGLVRVLLCLDKIYLICSKGSIVFLS